MCRRWRDIPKPSIAMVHGACIAGGLMLAWVCDLIVASDDAFFADPVVRMGIPGVEYFAHPWMLGPRFAKEALFTGDRFSAQRAYELGMVNRVVPRAELAETTFALADRVATMPPFGLSLVKRAVNQCEDLMGMRSGMDSTFGLHHVAHAHNAETGTDALAGMNARSMKSAAKSDESLARPVLARPVRSGEARMRIPVGVAGPGQRRLDEPPEARRTPPRSRDLPRVEQQRRAWLAALPQFAHTARSPAFWSPPGCTASVSHPAHVRGPRRCPFGYGSLHVVLGVATAWCVAHWAGRWIAAVAASRRAARYSRPNSIGPIGAAHERDTGDLPGGACARAIGVGRQRFIAWRARRASVRCSGLRSCAGRRSSFGACWSRRLSAGEPRGAAQAGLVLGLLMLTLAPWAVRNAHVFGRPIVTTTHGGYTLLLGNNPQYYDFLRAGGWSATWDAKDVYASWCAQHTLIETPAGAVADEPPPTGGRTARRGPASSMIPPASCLLLSDRLARFWGWMPLQTTPRRPNRATHVLRVAIGLW